MITTKLFQACQDWAMFGHRSMDIEFSTQLKKEETKIWLYSYEIGEGVFVETEADIPTDEQLKQRKRERAEAILSKL